ncbi:MAG: hypothetical protein V1934_06480 [Methanobacteriota archaeon]
MPNVTGMRCAAVLAIAAALLIPAVGTSQVPYTVAGRVTDSWGSPVPGAVVVVSNIGSGGSMETATDVSGRYLVDIAGFPYGYAPGDEIRVEVTAGALSTQGTGFVIASASATYLNLTIVDTTPPEIFHQQHPYVIACVPLAIECGVSDDMHADSVTFRYIQPGSSTALTLNMSLSSGTPSNGTWSAAVPALESTGTLNYWFEAADLSGNEADACYFSVPVLHGPLSALEIVAPSTVRAGEGFSVTVSARDLCGNLVSNYTGAVNFTSAEPYPATLPPSSIFTGSENGTDTFNGLALFTPPIQSITVTDAAAGLSATASIIVFPGPAMMMSWVPDEATMAAGSKQQFQARTVDRFGNPSEYSTNLDVLLSSSSSGGAFNPIQLALPAGGLSAPVEYSDVAVGGPHALKALPTDPLVAAGWANVTVLNASADAWHFDPQTASVSAGAPLWLNVSLVNSSGVTKTLQVATIVRLATSSSGGSFFDPTTGAVKTFVTIQAGAGKAAVIYKDTQSTRLVDKTYSHVLTASNGSFVATGMANVFIQDGLASALLLEGPSEVIAGEEFNIIAWAIDEYGNRAYDHSGMVYASSNDIDWGGAWSSFPIGGQAYATLQINLTRVGIWRLNVTTGGIWASSNISVRNARANALRMIGPTEVEAGEQFDVWLAVSDRFGNAAVDYTGNVTLASTDPYPAKLPGNASFKESGGGVLVIPGLSLFTTPQQKINVTTDNGALFAWASIGVVDTSPPIITVEFPSEIYSGEDFQIWVNASDTARIEYVSIEDAWMGSSAAFDLRMVSGNETTRVGSYLANATPEEGAKNFTFTVEASDGSNVVTSPETGKYTIEITDDSGLSTEWAAAIALIAIMTIIILLVFIGRRRRKPER